MSKENSNNELLSKYLENQDISPENISNWASLAHKIIKNVGEALKSNEVRSRPYRYAQYKDIRNCTAILFSMYDEIINEYKENIITFIEEKNFSETDNEGVPVSIKELNKWLHIKRGELSRERKRNKITAINIIDDKNYDIYEKRFLYCIIRFLEYEDYADMNQEYDMNQERDSFDLYMNNKTDRLLGMEKYLDEEIEEFKNREKNFRWSSATQSLISIADFYEKEPRKVYDHCDNILMSIYRRYALVDKNFTSLKREWKIWD